MNKLMINDKINIYFILGIVFMGCIKILHTADVHIGAREAHLEALAQQRRFETVFTFEKTVRLAAQNGVRLFLIAGDLFDSNRIEEVFIKRTLEAIKSAAEITFVFAAGNHDPLSADSPFLKHEIPENLKILPARDSVLELEALGVRVYGCSFDSVYKKGEERFLLTTPDDDIINILCIHGELKSDLNSDYNSVTVDFLKSCGMDYVALGHVHRRTAVQKIGKAFAAYCGCPEPHGFDETGKKGVYIGEIKKGECSLEFTATAAREYVEINVDITDKTDIVAAALDELQKSYGEGFRDNLYKIILTGEVTEDFKIDTAEISGRISSEVYFAKLRDKTTLKLNLKALANEHSLKGIFVKKCLERIDSAEDEAQKEMLKQALNIGVKAFSAEVKCDET